MELSNYKADVAVVGAGPGGYVAAIKAAQAGLNTIIIEAEDLGGVCLNWGCIPTKSLLKSAEMFMQINEAHKLGIHVENVSVDLQKIIDRSRAISNKLSGGISLLMKKNAIKVVKGFAQFKDENTLIIENGDGHIVAEVCASHIIVATGSKPRSVPGFEPDGDRVWHYKHALVPKELPTTMAVIGSGAIGIEFANFYHALGVDVHVIEVMDRILPVEDKDISIFAQRAMSQRGMKFLTATTVKSLTRNKDEVVLHLEKDGLASHLEVSHVITAMGVVPNTKKIGLEAVGVTLDERGFIQTNAFCQTSVSSIYAIGDVAGSPCLAHKASHEGILCIEAIVNKTNLHELDKKHIPACTYCFPQIASLGYRESEAKEQFSNVKIGKFPFQANGKALAIGEPEGFIKVIFNNDTGELIGAHMIGSEVTELIQGFSIAQMLEATEQEIAHTIFPHPTLSEMMHEAALDAYDKAIHI